MTKSVALELSRPGCVCRPWPWSRCYAIRYLPLMCSRSRPGCLSILSCLPSIMNMYCNGSFSDQMLLL